MTANSPLSDRPILVTGGGGFLGSAIIRMLVACGDAVRNFSRSRYPHLETMGIDQVQGDLADAEALQQACQGVELVFHVAAKAGVWGSYDAFHQANVVGTQNMLRACQSNNVGRLVYTSSPSVIFDGRNMEGVNESVPYPQTYHAHYPRTKAMAEKQVREAASPTLRTIALRPHLIWGPGDNHLVPRIIQRARRLRIIGEGNNKVDTIYIDNAAHAHILAAEKLNTRPELSGRVYFISQDEPANLWEWVATLLARLGLPPVRRRIGYGAARALGVALECVHRVVPGEPRLTRFVVNELARSHWYDIGRARRELGYVPGLSLEEALAKTLAITDPR